MTPIIAPAGAVAVKPVSGAAYTFLNSMDIRPQDTSPRQRVIGAGVALDGVGRQGHAGTGRDTASLHLVAGDPVAADDVSARLFHARHAAPQVDSRLERLRLVRLVNAAELLGVLVASGPVQMLEHVADDAVPGAHEKQTAELGPVDVIADDLDVLRAHSGAGSRGLLLRCPRGVVRLMRPDQT